jgi:ATP-dependent DNA helicase RecG
LHCHISPDHDFSIHEFHVDGMPVVIFKVRPATHAPIRFRGEAYIRVGSYKKKLKDFPPKEGRLWAIFNEAAFERGAAISDATSDEILALIDYPAFFSMTARPLPDNRAGILEQLVSSKIISPREGGRYHVTNLGAILFARDLKQFDRLSRKAPRVILYKGNSRVETVREQAGQGAMHRASRECLPTSTTCFR